MFQNCDTKEGLRDETQSLDETAFAALVLLLMDQLDHGMWGKARVVRMRERGHGHGSYCGTAFVFDSLRRFLGSDADRILELGCLSALPGYLAHLAQEGCGVYPRKRWTKDGVDMSQAPDDQAAALLLRLALESNDDLDTQTVEWLCNSDASLRAQPWDAAFAARAFWHWLRRNQNSGEAHLYTKTKGLYQELIGALSEQGFEQGSDIRKLWGPGSEQRAGEFETMYQWSVIWMMLDMLPDREFTDVSASDKIARAICDFIQANIDAQPDTSKRFAIRWEGTANNPVGELTFGTCIALVSLSVISEHFAGLREQAIQLQENVMARVLTSGIDLAIDLPPQPHVDEACNAWASILLVLSRIGCTLSPDAVQLADALAQQWRSIAPNLTQTKEIAQAYRQIAASQQFDSFRSAIEKTVEPAAARESFYRSYLGERQE